jgi:hypothetical protein
MYSVTVKPGSVRIPLLCVACGAPTTEPTDPAEKKAASLEASGSTRTGNRTFTEKISFPLCPACTEARKREQARTSTYPGHWGPWSLSILAAVAFVGWLIAAGSDASFAVASVFLGVGVVAIATSVLLQRRLRRQNDQANPRSDEDVRRLDLIQHAVSITPTANFNAVLSVGLSFNNDVFGRAFQIANSLSM